MADGGVGSNGSPRRGGGRSRWPPVRAFVTVGISGGLVAGLSLTLVSLAVRLTGATVSGGLPLALIVAGSLVVAAAGGWFIQPIVARLVSAAVRMSRNVVDRVRHRPEGR